MLIDTPTWMWSEVEKLDWRFLSRKFLLSNRFRRIWKMIRDNKIRSPPLKIEVKLSVRISSNSWSLKEVLDSTEVLCSMLRRFIKMTNTWTKQAEWFCHRQSSGFSTHHWSRRATRFCFIYETTNKHHCYTQSSSFHPEDVYRISPSPMPRHNNIISISCLCYSKAI